MGHRRLTIEDTVPICAYCRNVGRGMPFATRLACRPGFVSSKARAGFGRRVVRATSVAFASRTVREGLVVMALGAGLAGCVGPLPISPPLTAPAPMPEQGRSVSVMVSDERSEKSPGRIGIVQANNRAFVLEGGASLAARLADELVAALRTRGYRADHARDAASRSELSVLVRVVRFAADLPPLKKLRFQGRSVLVATVTASDSPGSFWTDVIDTREDTALSNFTKDAVLRKQVGQFFQKAVANLTDRVSAGLPPPRSGS